MNKRLFSVFLIVILISNVLAFVPAASADATIDIIHVSKTTVLIGGSFTASGTTSAPDKTTITIQSKRGGDGWITATSVNASGGSYSTLVTPLTTAKYRATWDDGGSDPHLTNEVTVYLKPIVSIHRSKKTIDVGKKVRLYGKFKPYVSGRKIVLQRKKGSHWVTYKHTHTKSLGAYSFTIKLTSPGKRYYRIHYIGTANYLGTYSKYTSVTAIWRNPFGVSSAYKHYIVVRRSNYRLYYIHYGIIKKAYNCGVGMPAYRTPGGSYHVSQKRYHPTWSNPGAGWASGMPSSIAWPSSPLGARALNLTGPASGIRIHGTTQPWLLDRSYRAISHGCIRLKNPNVIWLYNTVPVGTRVKVI